MTQAITIITNIFAVISFCYKYWNVILQIGTIPKLPTDKSNEVDVRQWCRDLVNCGFTNSIVVSTSFTWDDLQLAKAKVAVEDDETWRLIWSAFTGEGILWNVIKGLVPFSKVDITKVGVYGSSNDKESEGVISLLQLVIYAIAFYKINNSTQ